MPKGLIGDESFRFTEIGDLDLATTACDTSQGCRWPGTGNATEPDDNATDSNAIRDDRGGAKDAGATATSR